MASVDYETFDCTAYLQKSYLDPRSNTPNFCPEMRHYLMTQIHNFYNETLSSPPSPSASILEFGGGPVIAYLISAAPHASDIVFSDYCLSGRQAVSDWVAGAATAHDWSAFFEYVTCELEGADRGGDAGAERERELRSKLSAVVACDSGLEAPIGEGFDGRFDVVSVSFCFESACRSHDDVVMTLGKLRKMMKSKGWIRANGVRGGSYYVVQGNKFFNLTQTEETLRDSLAKAGFVNVSVDTFDNVAPAPNADYKGIYHVTAQVP